MYFNCVLCIKLASGRDRSADKWLWRLHGHKAVRSATLIRREIGNSLSNFPFCKREKEGERACSLATSLFPPTLQSRGKIHRRLAGGTRRGPVPAYNYFRAVVHERRSGKLIETERALLHADYREFAGEERRPLPPSRCRSRRKASLKREYSSRRASELVESRNIHRHNNAGVSSSLHYSREIISRRDLRRRGGSRSAAIG